MLEGVLTTDTSRDALLNGLLSQLGVPSVTPVPQPVAAVHGAGLDSGIVLDVGHRDSCCIAVVDGAALYHTTQCSRAAAAMVDKVIAVKIFVLFKAFVILTYCCAGGQPRAFQ